MSIEDPLQPTGSGAVHKAADPREKEGNFPPMEQVPFELLLSGNARDLPTIKLAERAIDSSTAQAAIDSLREMNKQATGMKSLRENAKKFILSLFGIAFQTRQELFWQGTREVVSGLLGAVSEHVLCQDQLDLKTIKGYVEAVEWFTSQTGGQLDPEIRENCEAVLGKMEEAKGKFAEALETPSGKLLQGEHPEMIKKIEQNGGPDLLHREEYEDEKGLPMPYSYKEYNHTELCESINEDLFSSNSEVRNAAVEKLLEKKFLLFVIDGVERCEVQNMRLPNGVSVISNRGGGKEYLKETRKKSYDRKEYLEYVLDQFKKAYPNENEALAAFFVYMQNFSATANSVVCYNDLPLKVPENLKILFGLAFPTHARRYTRMTMDEQFNITYEVVFDMSAPECKEKIRELVNARIIQFPEGYDENTFTAVTTIRSEIPAACDSGPNVTDMYKKYDQRGQNGKQKTYLTFAASYGKLRAELMQRLEKLCRATPTASQPEASESAVDEAKAMAATSQPVADVPQSMPADS